MKRLNNKGYMLVEIIMAFSLAFGILYFMMDLVIKIKNKNDDLLVETIVRTDQAIISNKIMEWLASENISDACDCFSVGKLNLSDSVNKVIVNNDLSDKFIINDYASFGNKTCDIANGNIIHINIPIKVKQIKDKNFDVDLYYKYDIATLPDDD